MEKNCSKMLEFSYGIGDEGNFRGLFGKILVCKTVNVRFVQTHKQPLLVDSCTQFLVELHSYHISVKHLPVEDAALMFFGFFSTPFE